MSSGHIEEYFGFTAVMGLLGTFRKVTYPLRDSVSPSVEAFLINTHYFLPYLNQFGEQWSSASLLVCHRQYLLQSYREGMVHIFQRDDLTQLVLAEKKRDRKTIGRIETLKASLLSI